MPVTSASQVDRIRACPGGVLLATADDPSDTAQAGTEAHARLLTPDALPGVFRAWLEADGADGQAGVRSRGIVFEAAFLKRGDERAVFLGSNIGRAYGDPPEPSSAGTADAIRVARVGGVRRFRVGDLKTGRAQLYGGALPDPAESGQLRTLAYLAWDAAGRPEQTEARLAWLFHDDSDDPPRSWVDEAPRPMTAPDLREWESVLLTLVRRGAEGADRGEYHRGRWCLYCGGFDFCPAQRDLLERVASQNYTPAAMGALSEKEIGDLWLDVRCAEQQAERARGALLAHVERLGNVSLGRTELIPARTLSRRIRDVPRLKAEAARLGIPAATVVREGATVEGIRAAFVAAQVGDTGNADEFLRRMEGLGVVEVVPSRAFLRERAARRAR